ncbi:hypothetical protein CF088_05085 [Clostridium botulinum]|uniref:hypothetical protein n=1 Tax=Clostridium botulinum TaxID=1491 RepID=UPI00090B9D52|nr:hypothetical protein [Clostridium botulinum]APH24208.1 hypothetical protein NPD1_3742 [Clostridium botulinum]APQ68157.1 hypothetical protein RSJ8_1869 [Clostridium botulinum]MBN3377582.1 hypothetical protein [Clostridium botulinum]MBN3404682.1 hypothetical protein [Clostridium botulinum]QDY17909.1 hypothetical protein CGQ27_12725 [Clostridium botulinum]
MVADRLRVVLEFRKTDVKELQLYGKLLKFSNPAAVVKDILKGTLPIKILYEEELKK